MNLGSFGAADISQLERIFTKKAASRGQLGVLCFLQMMTSWQGKLSLLLARDRKNPSATLGFHHNNAPVMRSLGIFFVASLKKLLNKQLNCPRCSWRPYLERWWPRSMILYRLQATRDWNSTYISHDIIIWQVSYNIFVQRIPIQVLYLVSPTKNYLS